MVALAMVALAAMVVAAVAALRVVALAVEVEAATVAAQTFNPISPSIGRSIKVAANEKLKECSTGEKPWNQDRQINRWECISD